MDINALNKANIENLTGLWKKMGTQPCSSFLVKALYASSSWPDRYWFDWNTDTNQISALDQILIQLPQHSIIPVWDGAEGNAKRLEQTIIENGFELSFQQMAMYLNLDNYIAVKHQPTNIQRIHTRQDIETWAKISGLAFGYEIDVAVIHKIADDPAIQLLLAYSEGQAAGTVLLYKTADIIGVHQVGVIEQYQRKGIAYSLMQHVLEVSNAWQGKYITLQASEAGEVLYSRLGFKQQFVIRNYHRVL